MSESPDSDGITPVNISISIQEIDSLNDDKKTLALTVDMNLRCVYTYYVH